MTQQHPLYSGMLHLKNNEFHQARDFFQNIVDLEPEHPEAHAWLAATYGRLMEEGSMLEKIGILPIFEQEVVTALELNPELVLARQVNGLRLLYTPKEFGGDPVMAVRELLYAVEHGVDDNEVFYALGSAYLASNDEEMAVHFYNKVLECDPEHVLAQQQINIVNKGVSS
jgi:tetratricopeptide (TPR) repeat protein